MRQKNLTDDLFPKGTSQGDIFKEDVGTDEGFPFYPYKNKFDRKIITSLPVFLFLDDIITV